MKLIPVGLQDESLREVDTWFDQHGIKAYFYTGLLQIEKKNTTPFRVSGHLAEDRVFIQADNVRFTAEQLGRHEGFHVLRRENPGLVQRLVEDLKNRYDKASFGAIVEKYIKRYRVAIDMTSEDAIWKIWEEILADAYAGIDPERMQVTAYSQTVQERTNLYTGERGRIQADGTRQTNGPNRETDIKNAVSDENGGQYSIQRTQSMEWAEQIKGALYGGNNIQRNDTLVVAKSSETGAAEEISDKPLAIPLSVLTKASSGKDVSHSIKKSKLAKLDWGIKNAPITIVNPERNAVVFVTNVKQGGLPVLVAFDMDATFDGDGVHKATSIHLQLDTMSMLESLPKSATVLVKKRMNSWR